MIGDRLDSCAPELTIRAARQSRIGNASLLVAGGGAAAVVTVILGLRGSFWAVGAAAALGVWVAYYYRLATLAVVARGDVLEVRNLFVTHRLDRSAIANVGLGQSSVAKEPNQTVVLNLAGGEQVSLDACARSLTAPRAAPAPELRARIIAWRDASLAEKPLQNA